MNEIIIVGLGPGPRNKLTVEVNDVLEESNKVYFRTIEHNIAKEYIDRGKKYFSYDSFYEKYDDFDSLYENIALDLINSAKEEETIIYAVPGNPKLDDRIIGYLDEKKEINVKILYGIGISEAALFKSSNLTMEEFTITNALSIEKHFYDYKKNNLITGIFNKYIASELKMLLLDYYPENYKVTFINNPMDENQYIEKIDLEDIDRLDQYGHLTSIFIESNKELESFSNLTKIMEHLRSDDGCSWDRKQKIEDLIPCMIEEVYEVVDAIEDENYNALEEELGDLLLQVIFQAQIVSERGYFDVYDVINNITKKLIRRHPHIFLKENESDESNWDDIKKEEYNESYIYESMERALKSLPSLMSAYKIQGKASKIGFDWNDISGAIDKLYEEIDELKEAIEKNDKINISEEFGDILFSVVNISRFVNVNPEITLRNTNKKFISRFKYMEETMASKNKEISSLSLDEMEYLWEKAKKEKKEKKA